MTCKDFQDRLDECEAPGLPAELQLHAAVCPACATTAGRVQAALAAYRLPDQASSVNLVPRLRELLPVLPAPRRVVSMRNWLLAGFMLLLSLGGLPLMAGYRTLSYRYGTGFSLPLILVMSLVLSLYVGLFVLSHLDEFAARLKLRTLF
jgi:hypothetical protein